MKRICTICARGGSKGVPGKNIREIAGKPLIAYSILQAKDCGLFDAVAVSSDSSLILQTAEKYGADYLIQRPLSLARDSSAKLPAIRHCVSQAQTLSGQTYDIVVDLDATSPLRGIEDIRGAVSLLEKTKADNVITAASARRSPYFNMVELDEIGRARLVKRSDTPVIRRQDTPECFDMNASIYVWFKDKLFESDSIIGENTMLYVMPEERSIDIDSKLDFEIVSFLMRKQEAIYLNK